jgi:hypothetical protein
MLRDYFLRLGGDAAVDQDGIVSVAFERDEDADVEEYLSSWAATNGVHAAPEGQSPPLRQETAPLESATRGDVRPPLRVGDLLLSKGMITDDQLAEALVESRETGELLGRVLVRRRFVFEADLARTLAEQWNLPYLNLAQIGVDRSAMLLLPPEIGVVFAAVPVRCTDTGVQVAFADPSDAEAVDVVRAHIANIDPAVAAFADIQMAWRSVTRSA